MGLDKVVKSIIVNLQVEGVHCWKECPIKEVSYLKDIHRHVFFITVEKVVSHNERDIEIIQFKKKINDYLTKAFYSQSKGLLNFENMSCESIAEQILNKFSCQMVQVLEDNENGAKIRI